MFKIEAIWWWIGGGVLGLSSLLYWMIRNDWFQSLLEILGDLLEVIGDIIMAIVDCLSGD